MTIKARNRLCQVILADFLVLFACNRAYCPALGFTPLQGYVNLSSFGKDVFQLCKRKSLVLFVQHVIVVSICTIP